LRSIRWSPAAADDVENIRDYLHEHHPSFTQSTIRKLYEAARSLKQLPQRGRVGQTPNTRELVLSPLPYIIVYGVESDVVNIFRILHAARERK
jgi:toxin ParE1/3/4